MADTLLTVVSESEESVMNSRVRIVKRSVNSEPKQSVPDGKATELVRNREMVAVVKSWIDDFKLRTRQERRVTLPLPNRA